MTWQAITIIVLYAIGGTVHLLKHGDMTKISFWSWCTSTAITLTLLITGGFFG